MQELSWDFPGGKFNHDETPTQCVVRETKEETSLDINPGSEKWSAEFTDERNHLLFHYFEPQALSEGIRLSDDHTAYRWADEQELATLDLHPSVTLYLEGA